MEEESEKRANQDSFFAHSQYLIATFNALFIFGRLVVKMMHILHSVAHRSSVQSDAEKGQ